jgi:hypothetical protein
MRRVTAVLSVAAVVLWAAAAFAQGKDFSGKWSIDTEKMAAAGGGGGGGNRGGGGGGGGRGGGGPMTITQDAKMLTIEREGPNGATKTVYNLDGSVSKNPGRGGAEQESTAKWDGAKLVITTKTANGEQVSSWYMEGANLVQETTTQNGPRKVYYKKG